MSGPDALVPTEQFVSMTVIVQDPDTVDGEKGWPLTASLPVPVDRLTPGPRGHRFHVIDIDLADGVAYSPADLTQGDGWNYVDKFSGALSRRRALNDREFQAQNVYAIAARTLATFERVLGRRVPWAIASPVLNLVPRAIAEANAYYSRDEHAILFGYIPGRNRDNRVLTCLSHDIIAHEVTHAILDGLRPRYVEPALPDQPAFHEALADVVALLSVLGTQELVDHLIRGAKKDLDEINVRDLTAERLMDTSLMRLADEFGRAVHPGRSESLRHSLKTVQLNSDWKTDSTFNRAHRRAEVIVAGIMHSYLQIWTDRLEPYIRATGGKGKVSRWRVAEEGAKAAQHLLGMVVRSVDYLPPVDVEFGDVVEAILAADEVVVPDDRYQYRAAIEDTFASLGIYAPSPDMTELAGKARPSLDYRFLNLEALGSSPEEVYRFIWQNMEALGLDSRIHLIVDRTIRTTRSGAYGLVVHEIVADYSQVVDVPAGKLYRCNVRRGKVPKETMVQLWGGGVLVFNQFGHLRQHKRKLVFGDKASNDRQTRRLKYLAEHHLSGRDGSYGASMGTSRGERFAALHGETSPETW